MALGSARQEQRRPQLIPVGRRQGDVVDKNVVQRSLSQPQFPLPTFAEFRHQMRIRLLPQGVVDVGDKVLGKFQLARALAVSEQPVYNPALRCLP